MSHDWLGELGSLINLTKVRPKVRKVIGISYKGKLVRVYRLLKEVLPFLLRRRSRQRCFTRTDISYAVTVVTCEEYKQTPHSSTSTSTHKKICHPLSYESATSRVFEGVKAFQK